jgi:hypothetical protein
VQLAVHPDAIIGAEDITLAVWVRARLSEPILRARRGEIADRNARTAHRGLDLVARLPNIQVINVASAHDYDSAHDAGEKFAAAGLTAAAMGFGAFMADDQWVSSVVVRGHARRLPRSLPMRYIRTALVSRGFFDGWASVRGAPTRFHFLGLGAPIMLPLAALSARDCPQLTFDATSPIKDAVGGSLYVSRPAPLTVRTWKVADRLASSTSDRWTCPCGFCRSFVKAHPFDLEAARTLRLSRAAPYTSDDLRADQPLGKAMPLFRIAVDPLGRKAEQSRIGHNHWALGTLANKLTESAANLESYVEKHVTSYEQNAGATYFADAVRLAFEIVRARGTFWD